MFSRSDRNNILIIIAIIIAVNLGFYLYSQYDKPKPESQPTTQATSETNNQSPTLFPFNPNTIDSTTLAKLPINKSAIKAILHYRQAGGVFRTPSDLSRIYTLSEEEFIALEPYIQIPQNETSEKRSTFKAQRETGYHTKYQASSNKYHNQPARLYAQESPHTTTNHYPSHPKQAKTNVAHSIDIAIADTSQFKTIPGVGTYYANKIVRYRQRLGGFVSLNQLKEIEGLPADITTWVRISNTPVQKLKINLLTFGQLLRHPYINFEQVKAIFNHRKNHGPIQSFDDLKTYTAFAANDFTRLTPYIDFDIN